MLIYLSEIFLYVIRRLKLSARLCKRRKSYASCNVDICRWDMSLGYFSGFRKISSALNRSTFLITRPYPTRICHNASAEPASPLFAGKTDSLHYFRAPFAIFSSRDLACVCVCRLIFFSCNIKLFRIATKKLSVAHF